MVDTIRDRAQVLLAECLSCEAADFRVPGDDGECQMVRLCRIVCDLALMVEPAMLPPVEIAGERLPQNDGKRLYQIHRHYIGLSARASNCLRNLGLETLGDIDNTPDRVFLHVPNFGRKSLNELRADINNIRARWHTGEWVQ